MHDIGTAARNAQLHPFTSLARLRNADPVVVSAGDGCWVTLAGGQRLLDGAAGLWCVNVGHGRREIIEAVHAQMGRLAFFQAFNATTSEPAVRLAQAVLARAPQSMRRVFFGNSGSDANDTAVKLIWLYNNLRGRPAKKKLIARRRGYHGVTVMAGSLTGLPNVHAQFDLPLTPVRHVSAPDRFRAPERDAADYAAELEAMILAEGPETVAAFFAEPVMGTGGVLPPPPGYFAAIREVLDRHDVLLVLDEVISGFGRLGSWFGARHFGVEPDLITCAKGLTSSYIPMSAVLIGDRLWSVLDSPGHGYDLFSHGFTTSAHPVAAAAALANLDIIEREDLVGAAGARGASLLAWLEARLASHPLVGDVRGCGLMAAVELVADRGSKQGFPPALGVGAQAYEAARRHGLLVRALPGDILALSPPFTIGEDELALLVDRLALALDEIAGALRRAGQWNGGTT